MTKRKENNVRKIHKKIKKWQKNREEKKSKGKEESKNEWRIN